MGRGSSWQPESDTMKAWSVMRHKKAATDGWSRFDTKTAGRTVMTAILNEILPLESKRRAVEPRLAHISGAA